MSKSKNKIRSSNKLIDILNAPLSEGLIKKRSKAFMLVFLLMAIVGFTWYFSSQIGLKAGLILTLMLIFILITTIFRQRYIDSLNIKFKAFEKYKK